MKRKKEWSAAFAALLCLVVAAPAAAQNIHDTRLLNQPAVSENHIVFAYAGDLWVANLDGSGVRRLTTHVGTEVNPRFSPDGRLIAFSAQYEGVSDVYVVSVEGGVPKRLTWHPGSDVVQGFTPDGHSVLFTSPRTVFTNRFTQLFTVPVEGGHPEQLPIPNAYKAAYSPDGRMIAYTPLGERFLQWKNYRGGTVSRIWLYNTRNHEVEQIPQPEGRCNDTDPMWIGDNVYFRSDRNGEFNLFSYDLRSKGIEQLTDHDDFPVVNASAGGGKVIYEQAGYLHLYDPDTGHGTKLTVGIAADLAEVRTRYVEGTRFIRNAGISPSGARAVFEFRGEIVTVPSEKGDHRHLTSTSGVHERSPAWSPDGKWIVHFSDVSGEYELCIAGQDGREDVRTFKIDGAGFYEDPKWSPDGKKISFSDNSWSLYMLDIESGRVEKIASETLYGPVKILHHAWSPDSRWLAYTLYTLTYFQQVYLYSVEEGKSYPITDGLSDVTEPVFDEGGKYLYFTASTDAGPVRSWFAMSNADMEMSNSLYLAVLPKGEISPFARESDEEIGEQEAGEEEKPEEKGDEEVRVEIDFEDLAQRIVALPLGPANYYSLQAGPSGQLYYLKREEGRETSLRRYDLDKREEETLLENVSRFFLSADNKKVLIRSGNNWLIADSTGKISPGSGKITADQIQVRVDPREEWEQIFNEAWRINRDYFYDPNMHGADWPAMREKYRILLSDCVTRAQLNLVIRWMCSEVAVGHHRVGGGDTPSRPETVPGGLLGADYEIHRGLYRFKKIYGGLNWNRALRSPLTEPGVDVKAGEYLLAVGGVDLRPPENLYSRFENTAGKTVEITVGPSPNGRDSRTVKVVPITNEYALRNRDWVEGNLKKVDEATGGRVAYVYVPNTTTLGHTYFKRYFYPQTHKDAIIVDERFNGGGSVADYYIDLLRRPEICYWAMRYGADLKTPLSAIQGPRVMLIDETAGSGGDLLPWMWRKLGMGKLIGKRTWGGLVGTLGFPVLLDGGYVSAPNLAIWTEDGFVVENVGVPPDIEVEQMPADIIAGRDPQLEKAIEEILEQLEANPPVKLTRPPYPIRVRKR
jgi:tricorn protease